MAPFYVDIRNVTYYNLHIKQVERYEVKYSELIKKLKKAGCTLMKHGTNHDEWYSPITGKKIRVPRHQGKDAKKGIAEAIMRDAGIR